MSHIGHRAARFLLSRYLGKWRKNILAAAPGSGARVTFRTTTAAVGRGGWRPADTEKIFQTEASFDRPIQAMGDMDRDPAALSASIPPFAVQIADLAGNIWAGVFPRQRFLPMSSKPNAGDEPPGGLGLWILAARPLLLYGHRFPMSRLIAGGGGD